MLMRDHVSSCSLQLLTSIALLEYAMRIGCMRQLLDYIWNIVKGERAHTSTAVIFSFILFLYYFLTTATSLISVTYTRQIQILE